MERSFEEQFSEIQTNKVEACLEYVKNILPVTDKLFLFTYMDSQMLTSDYFFQIHGQVVRKEKIGDALKPEEKQLFHLDYNKLSSIGQYIGRQNMNMVSLFKKYNRELPTESFLVFLVKTRQLEENIKYIPEELLMDKDPDLDFDAWLAEEKAKAGQGR